MVLNVIRNQLTLGDIAPSQSYIIFDVVNEQFEQTILRATGAHQLYEVEVIQSLWSGYGKIVRIGLEGGNYKTVVVKLVQLPQEGNHPRGWNSNLSHQRKVRSYQVETNWYTNYANECDERCKVPTCIVMDKLGDEVLILLEDLDEAGYPARKQQLEWEGIEVCLKWLANFHAKFMNRKPDGLWPKGTYWHLETRPDELEALEDPILKRAASSIDEKLNSCKYQTFVHGDAKLANFCFAADCKKVAAVDFQYVGGGCGMKDVAYFIGSCLNEHDAEKYEESILQTYFTELEGALQNKIIDYENLKEEWYQMYRVAWADFHRFLKGWSPGHWKINTYSEKISRQVAKDLVDQKL